MFLKFTFAISMIFISGVGLFCLQDTNEPIVERFRSEGVRQQPVLRTTVENERHQGLRPDELSRNVRARAFERPSNRVIEINQLAERSVSGTFGNFDPDIHRQRMELQQAVAQYRRAEDAETRQLVREDISTILGSHYDFFLDKQEEQIQQLEQRVADLRAQFDRRRDAKQRLVELKLEMIISQVEGLGWPGDPLIPSEPLDDISRFFLENSRPAAASNHSGSVDRVDRFPIYSDGDLPQESELENYEKIPITEIVTHPDGTQRRKITGYRFIPKRLPPEKKPNQESSDQKQN